jgi:hypothetical protein
MSGAHFGARLIAEAGEAGPTAINDIWISDRVATLSADRAIGGDRTAAEGGRGALSLPRLTAGALRLGDLGGVGGHALPPPIAPDEGLGPAALAADTLS